MGSKRFRTMKPLFLSERSASGGKILILFVFSVLFSFVIGCKGPTKTGNNPPVIYSLIPSKRTANFFETITVRAIARDADGDSIRYQWYSPKGRILSASGDSAVWQAPDSVCTVGIQLRVFDVFKASDFDSVSIAVQNRAPVISSLTASQTSVLVGSLVTLSVTAQDPDGGQVSYLWSADEGEFVGSKIQSAATWRAATTVANVSITVKVTDATNQYSTSSIVITVFQEYGSLWIADTFNDQIVKLASNGTQLLRNSGFNRPQGLALDITDRTLWIADRGNNKVVKYSSSGSQLFEVKNINRPTDVSVQANGNVWITCMSDTFQVIEISYSGTILRQLAGFSTPQSIAVNRLNGDIWIADTGKNRIVLINSQVPNLYNIDSSKAANPRYDTQFIGYTSPEALDVDPANDICWVADTGNHRVVRLRKSDLTEFVIAGFRNPRGIVVNKVDASCWVANTGDNEVVKLYSNISLLPNKTPWVYNIDTDAGFHYVIPNYTQPWAIDINSSDGIVWFSENFRIIKVKDLGYNFSIIGVFTNFNSPKALIVNPGGGF